MGKPVACLAFKSASSILVFCLHHLVRCVQPHFAGHREFSSSMMAFVSLDRRTMSEQGHCHILWQDKLPLQVHPQLQVRGALHGKSWAFTCCCSAYLLIKYILRALKHMISQNGRWSVFVLRRSLLDLKALHQPDGLISLRYQLDVATVNRTNDTAAITQGSEQMWNLGSGDNTQPNFKAHSLRSMV